MRAAASQFSTEKTEIDGNGHQARLRGRGVDLRPLQAVEGEDGHPVAFSQAEPEKRIGEPAGARVPLEERHGSFQVANADLFRKEPGVRRENFADIEEITHATLPRSDSLWCAPRAGKNIVSPNPFRLAAPLPPEARTEREAGSGALEEIAARTGGKRCHNADGKTISDCQTDRPPSAVYIRIKCLP
jgi:hypothetical protein